MKEDLDSKVLSLSSSWVAVLLNIIPGIGIGYIYQRRWKAYWVTVLISIIWTIFTGLKELSIDPSDPIQVVNNGLRFYGVLLISLVTSIEAALKVKYVRSIKKSVLAND